MADFIFQDIAGTMPIKDSLQYVGAVSDLKGVGTPYNANAATNGERRQWNGWGYLNPAFENTELTVTLPDLGSNCSIIIATPEGVSIQESQAISGEYALPPYPVRVFCIVNRALTAQEKIDIQTRYGTRYFVNYDATIAARALSGTIYHTDTDLGWTPNTDVGASGEVQALINLLADGDTVVFDAMYKISGNYSIYQSNVTFRAATRQQCGFNCLDGIEELADNNSLPVNNDPVFAVGEGFLADGLKLTQDTVDTFLSGMWGGGNKAGWFATGNRSSFYMIDCYVDTMGWIGVKATATSGIVIARNTLKDIKYCVYLYGACDNPVFAHNYFTGGYPGKKLGGIEDNKFYDGVKTIADANSRGPRNALFVENVLVDIIRDSIDTTGGLKDAIVDANVHHRVNNNLDLKSIYDTSEGVANGPIENTGVSMHYNLFDDFPGNAVAISTSWSAPETPDPSYAAGPISSYRNIYRITTFGPNVALNRNAKGLISDQDTFIGDWKDHFVRVIDDYTPSLVEASERTNAIYIP